MPSITVFNLNAGATLNVPSDINGNFSTALVAPRTTETLSAHSDNNENFSKHPVDHHEEARRTSMGVTTTTMIVFTFSRTDVAGQADISYSTNPSPSGSFTIKVDTTIQANATYDLTPTAKDGSGRTLANGAAIRGLKTVAAPVVNPNSNSN